MNRDALEFVRLAREDATLTAELSELAPEDGLAPVLAVAARAGFVFDTAELREAHRVDWELRWVLYAASSRANAATTVAVVKSAPSST